VGPEKSPPPLDPPVRREELARLRAAGDDDRLREPSSRHDDRGQWILVLDGGAMGPDEPLRLGALRLRDDQNTGDSRRGVGHATSGAGRQGMATGAGVAGFNGPRRFRGVGIRRRQLFNVGARLKCHPCASLK